MADASEELTYIIRMVFPDAKVPPLDTKEAEAALDRIRNKAISTQQAVAAATSGAVGGAAMPALAAAGGFGAPFTMGWDPRAKQAVFTYPTGSPYAAPPAAAPPDPRAGAAWATRPQYGPWNTSWNMYPGAQGSAGPSYGPVSDPGSWARSSMSTGRGYDQAMLREQLQGINLDSYAQGLQKLRVGMSQVRESATGLAASVILLNKAFQEGSGFDNPWTMAVGGIGAVSHGANLLHGAGRAIQGGATIGGRVAQGLGAFGLASQLGGLAGMSGLGLAGITALPAAITAGAFYFAPGGFRETWAEQERQDTIGVGLDRQLAALRSGRDNRSSAFTSSTHWIGRGMSADNARDVTRFQAGIVTASQLQAENVRRIRALDLNSGGLESRAADEGSSERVRLLANQELLANLRQQQDYYRQNVEAARQETSERTQLLQISRRQTEQDRDRAQSAAESFGRMSDRDLQKRSSLVSRAMRNGLDWRTASAIERLGGETSATSEFFTRRGQSGVNAIPEGFRPEGSQTSAQITQLENKLKQLEEVERSLVGKLGDTVDVMSANVLGLEQRLIKAEQAQATLNTRLQNTANGFIGR